MNGLSTTRMRVAVLETFYSTGKAYSMSGLLKQVDGSNRITLYRTLKSFVEKKILAEVSGKNNYPVYVLQCPKDSVSSFDYVAFFICRECGKTLSLQTDKPNVKGLPGNVSIEEEKLILSGTCGDCTPARNANISLRGNMKIPRI